MEVKLDRFLVAGEPDKERAVEICDFLTAKLAADGKHRHFMLLVVEEDDDQSEATTPEHTLMRMHILSDIRNQALAQEIAGKAAEAVGIARAENLVDVNQVRQTKSGKSYRKVH